MQVFIGYEPREHDAFSVAVSSALKHNDCLNIRGIVLAECKGAGLYRRPTSRKNGHLWDDISDAPMATEFALTRFLLPQLADPDGDQWALFMDCDMLVRCDLDEILAHADDKYAVMCVKHDIDHGTGEKMDGCEQTSYDRKNWSSVMLWNLNHPAHRRLTARHVNTAKGRWLHQFGWLHDDEIGGLSPVWNHLVGLSPPNGDAKIVHYTLGIPSMAGYKQCEHSREWRNYE